MEQFFAKAKEALIELYGEKPKTNPDYSRIINAREVTRLTKLIDPAKVVVGGESDPDLRFLAPTIVFRSAATTRLWKMKLSANCASDLPHT